MTSQFLFLDLRAGDTAVAVAVGGSAVALTL